MCLPKKPSSFSSLPAVHKTVARALGIGMAALFLLGQGGSAPPDESIRTFKGHKYSVGSVAFSPDGKYALSVGTAGIFIRLWEVATGKEIRTFEEVVFANSVVFSPDGKYALSGGMDGALKFWEVATGEKVRNFKGPKNWVSSVAFSPDGQYALSGGVGSYSAPLNCRGSEKRSELKLWEVKTGREIRTFMGTKYPVHSVAFSPDGKYALSGGGRRTKKGELKLWEVATGREVRSFGEKIDSLSNTWHRKCVTSVAFSPDGKYVLSGARTTLKLWEVATGRKVRNFKGHGSRVSSVAFSPDGKYVVSGAGTTLNLREVASGKEIHTFTGHKKYVTSTAFSPDGKYAISGSGKIGEKGVLKLWDLRPYLKN